MLSGKRHSLAIKQDAFAPVLNAALSVPLALLFGPGIQLLVLGLPGDPTGFTISLIGLGILTSLDIHSGWRRTVIGFAVSLFGFAYLFQGSTIFQSQVRLSIYDGSAIIAAFPPALAVLLAGFLLSEKSRYKMVKASVLATLGLVVGLVLGAAGRSIDSSSLLILAALAGPANAAQIVLLQGLNKLWRARRLSLSMMPTAFFVGNLLSFTAFVSSFNLYLLYPFLASLAFLPAFTLLGFGTGSLGQKGTGTLGQKPVPVQSAGIQRVTITGDTMLAQGRQQTLRITTEAGGQPKSGAEVRALLTRPGGKTESLKVSRVSDGRYKVSYLPRGSGSYRVHVVAASRGRTVADQSFNFEVQPPPPRHPPPPPPQAAPRLARPAPSSPPPAYRPAPLPTPSPAPSIGSLPKLANWNPQLWVGQDVHGYKVKEHLASGATGYVLRASFEHGGMEMAIKIPILKPEIGSTALEETMTEATRLLELSEQSKYVVQLRGILVDRLNVQEILKGDAALYLRSPPAIVMEFMKGGTAKKLLEDSSYESLYYSEKWGSIVMLIGQMIATGLETIHKAGFTHLDVKPQNIMFNTNPPTTGADMVNQLQSGTLVPKLGDLGSAVKVGGKVNQFTSEYAPGDQVLGGGAAQSMDVYALGATLFALMTKTPFNSRKLIEAMNEASRDPRSGRASNELRSAWEEFRPDFGRIDKFPSAVPILKRMLTKDPQQRPDAGTVASSLKSLKDLKMSK